MNKNEIFFADNGLTSTSANHVANLAKEWIQQKKSRLESVHAVNKYIQLIGSDEKKLCFIGMTSSEINEIPQILNEISDAQSLIAWLREAIKARTALKEEIENTDIKMWDPNLLDAPESPTYMSEDEAIAQLSIKERNRYYELETKCAVIGKFIHPDGSFSKARKEINSVLENPIRVNESGRDTLIFSYEPSVDPQKVESLFFNLQQKHREAQAELNGIKHKIELIIEEDHRLKLEKYSKEIEDYNSYHRRKKAEFDLWWTQELEKIQNLKIIIPNDLHPIYEKIINLK